MKKLLFLLLVSFVAKAQSIQGTLINSETKEPIPYATIKIDELKKSELSKSDGKFIFNETIENDVLLEIEAWGFENKKISVSDLKKNNILELTESVEVLREIIIPPANAKISYKNYGRTNEGSGFLKGHAETQRKDYYDNGSEFGIVVSNKGLSQLESFHLHLSDNHAKKIVFKLQLYEVKNGKPSNKIDHEEVYITIVNKDRGWLVLDLIDKNIFVDSDISKFAFTLKLVDAEFDSKYTSLIFNIGTTVNNHLIVKFSEYESFSKIPFSIPMYIKAKVYN